MDIEQVLAGAGTSRKPPTDIAPSELIRRLGDTRRPSEEVPFVRRTEDGQPLFSYRMMVLSVDDLDVARANADLYTRTKLRDQLEMTEDQARQVRAETWEAIYKDALVVEVLYASMRQAEDVTKRVWDAPSQIRKLLTTDEVAALFDTYQGVQFRLGPIWRMFSEEECEAWIERLTAGAGAYPFVGLEQGQLIQLATSLAYRLRSLKTAIGSSGLPTSDGQHENSPKTDG